MPRELQPREDEQARRPRREARLIGSGRHRGVDRDAQPPPNGRQRYRAYQRQPVGARPAPGDAAGEIAGRIQCRRLRHQSGKALDVGTMIVLAQCRIGVVVMRARAEPGRAGERWQQVARAGERQPQRGGGRPACAVDAAGLASARMQGQVAAQQVESGARVGQDDDLGRRQHAARRIEELPETCVSSEGRDLATAVDREQLASALGIRPGQAGRLDPAAAGEVPGRSGDGHAGDLPGLACPHGAHIVRRQAEWVEQGLERRQIGVAPGQPEQSRRAAVNTVPGDRRRDGVARLEGSSAMEARVMAVVAVNDAVEYTGGIARAFLRQCRPALEHGGGPPPLGERAGEGATGQTAAADGDRQACALHPRPGVDHRPLARPRTRREPRCEAGNGDLALATAAWKDRHFESGRCQAVANRSRDRPGRHRRLGRGDPRHRLEQSRLPHPRVACRREAVEEEGIDAGDQLRQPVADVAEREKQLHAPALEAQAMQVAGERRPGRGEPGSKRHQALIARLRGEVMAPQRPGLDREEVQAVRALRIFLPRFPGREEVVAETEAGLEHDEPLATAPAPRQAVAGEEDVPCLGQGALPRVVDVAELGRARQPVGIPLEPAGDDGNGLHASAGSASMRRRSASSRRSRTAVRPR